MWMVTERKIRLAGSGQDKGLGENAAWAEKAACWHERSVVTLLLNGVSLPDVSA